jgi:ABC-2 type transport system ATP-binding protein
LVPTSGSIEIMGLRNESDAAKSKLGLVFGTRTQLWMNLSVYDSLLLTCEVFRIPRREQAARLAQCAEIFQVNDLLKKRVRTLSLGQRMRCEIVASILHKPEILLLDEPTIGLDVVSKYLMRDLLTLWQREEKTTLLLTSHDMSDVEKLCDRVLLINKGELEFDGPLQKLKGQLALQRRIELVLDTRITAQLENVSAVEYTHSATCDAPEMENTIAKLLIAYQGKIQDLRIQEVPLEEVLMNRFGRQS